MTRSHKAHYSFIFSHGFGFTKKYWQNILPFFQDYECLFFDKFCEKQLQQEKQKIYIGIGHSLGFSSLYESSIHFECLIGLQGFVNFLGNDIRLKKTREKYLNKITQDFQTDHITSLLKFHADCGCYDEQPVIEKTDLLKDLGRLRNAFVSQKQQKRIIIFGSNDDKIVPMSIIYDNFELMSCAEIYAFENAKHSLGHNNANVLFQMIGKLL